MEVFLPKIWARVRHAVTHTSDEVVAVSGRGSIVGKVVDIVLPKIASVEWGWMRVNVTLTFQFSLENSLGERDEGV